MGEQESTANNQSSEDTLSSALETLKGRRVLLVEDVEFNQIIACDLLESEGIEVVTVWNGKEALEMLEKETFDGILMDCQMPVMDGYEATKKIRQIDAYKDLPIIAMTANAMKQDIEMVREAGMNDHIAKPVDSERMYLAMAKWISQKTVN